MRAYVTGAAGFVGRVLTAYLSECGDEVVAADLEVDVTDAEAVGRSLRAARPEVVYHLAGFAHVGRSWSAPAETFRVNALGTLNVLEAAAGSGDAGSPPRVILVSSAEVYGTTAGAAAVTEAAPMLPVSPYAASKASAEILGLQSYLGRGLPVVRARPFNHVGPGQTADFVVSGIARRIVEAERRWRGGPPAAISVGNLQAQRDFTDVRDVVTAYRLLAERGRAGDVYNIASGSALAVGTLVERLVQLSEIPLELVEDPQLMRPVDVPVLIGDASKLHEETGWSPSVPMETTLAQVLDEWRRQLDK
jgi:GDP-4-dehydro-6-deoxy-D-mannose reductase